MQLSTHHSRILAILIIAVFTTSFVWFVAKNPVGNLTERLPGMDNRPKEMSESDPVIIGEFFELYRQTDTYSSGSWPRFRGPDYNNIVLDPVPIADSWPENGPPVIWQIKVGEGHAAASIHNGKVYLLDYDENRRADALRCFLFNSGEELWRRWYNVVIKRNHGMSRTIPSVTDDYVITIGPRCHVMCCGSNSGDLLWTLDLVRDYGAEMPQWYTAQCPLINGDLAVIAVGGESLLLGIDCRSGNIIWETPNPDKWKMSHSSVIPAIIHDRKMYIYMAIGGICGIAADGDRPGEILWKTSEWNPTVIAPSPVYIGNNEIVFTAGYGAGGGKLRVNKTGSTFSAEVVEVHTPREGLASEQQTPILTGEYIWTIQPKDAGEMRSQLVCYHISDLQTPVWSSGKENRYGLGPYLVVGDKLFLMNDDAELFMFRFNTNSMTLLNSFKVLEEGADAWGPMAFADGYLVVRDSYNLVCLYIGE